MMLKKHIQEERIYSPKNLENNTNSYQGSLYGTSSNNILSSFLRHPNFQENLKIYFSVEECTPRWRYSIMSIIIKDCM